MKIIIIFLILTFCFKFILTSKFLERTLKNNIIIKNSLYEKLNEQKVINNNNKNNNNINNKNLSLNIFIEKEEEKFDKIRHNIIQQIEAIKKIDKNNKDLISEMKNELKEINDKYTILNNTLNNIKAPFIKNLKDKNNYSLKTKLFICLIILLAIVVYIIELKYENNNNEGKQNSENISSFNNIKNHKNQNSTKLYLSL